jgi:hypothetical protein
MPYKDPAVRRRYFRELMRRRRAEASGITKAVKPSAAADDAKDARIRELEAELVQARKRIAELERRGEGQLKARHSTRDGGRPVEFTEVGRLRAEIVGLKSDIRKFKAALQEEPDAAKLRKKVVDLQAEKAAIRQELRRVAKERDEYRSKSERYAMAKHREARAQLTRKNHNAIINALHADRLKQCTPAELAEAHRVATLLRPLFLEDR